jgi:hypothetical protein
VAVVAAAFRPERRAGVRSIGDAGEAPAGHVVRRASVGAGRPARSDGQSPATAPIETAAPTPCGRIARDGVWIAKALDQLGKALELLGRGGVVAGKLGGLDRVAEPRASQAQLACLEGVLAAADDVEAHSSPKFRDDAREIPACGVLAVLVDITGP